MPAPLDEIKFSSPLELAFSTFLSAVRHKKSISVLLLKNQDQVDEISAMIQSFIRAEYPNSTPPAVVHAWSSWDHSPFSPVTSSITQKINRLKTLDALLHSEVSLVVLSSVEAWIQPTLPKAAYLDHQIQLSIGDDIHSRDDFRSRLRSMGYFQQEIVNEAGQFTFRGEILDIYSPTLPYPLRIEFFDTVVENIRYFHPETQRTLKSDLKIENILIRPAEEVIFPWDKTQIVLEKIKTYCDQNQISRKIRDPIFENIRSGFLPDHFRTWIPFIYQDCGRLFDYLPSETKIFSYSEKTLKNEISIKVEQLKAEEKKYSQPYWITPRFELLYPELDTLLKNTLSLAHPLESRLPVETISTVKISEAEVREWLDDGFKVWIGTRGVTHQERLKYILKKFISYPGLKLLEQDLHESLQFLSEKQIIISESLILGTHQKTSKKSSKANHPKYEENNELQFNHLQDLAAGDFVVHSLHGVGKFIGLQELKSGGQTLGEYLLIEYTGGDRLFLPVYRLNTIQRYVSAGGNPSLDKLGTGQFEKAKQKARESARKLAVNLIEIYAKRALLKGPQFSVPDEEYFEFCDQFDFTETEGQLKSTQEIFSDLESGKLLDRLVCGDVGFGKTEVAMRAAFLAVQRGYQVAVLVPTTLLAFQHEQSFKRRMKEFPIQIESISRFKTKKQQNEIINNLGVGKIDILIGTHRILSKDVEWGKLGLLVVDEEHRFGVDHKEKIKAIQSNTHTLTLTATPIPRTLNMTLSGLKDISVIKTPPTNRQPIKTFVSSYDEELIKSAINNELERGGQIFYLYNRVQTIENQAQELRKLFPNAKISVAHGQMSESEIEARMLEFYHGQVQILVCTTIIESGIDVPNAGTMIIHRADQLGLAQLYQIRGRVGRSHRKAYAYLLVNDESTLTQEARMRLDVLQRFVDLGSGFQIASYDLEIRGGGNFLGAEQSGHVSSVGLDLFTELLEEAIQELKGKKIDIEERHFEPEIQVPATCEISPSFISDSKLRLSFYRKLSQAKNDSQVDSLYDEFKDRYGEIPPETENLFWLIRIKNLLKLCGIEQLSINALKTSMTVRKSTLIELDEVMKLYMGPKGLRDTRVSITPDSKIVLQIQFMNLQSHLFELETLLKKIAPKAFASEKTD